MYLSFFRLRLVFHVDATLRQCLSRNGSRSEVYTNHDKQGPESREHYRHAFSREVGREVIRRQVCCSVPEDMTA